MRDDLWTKVDPDTLSVTHIYDGEEVVTGGEDGQVWIATFASRRAAERFVDNAACQLGIEIYGIRFTAVNPDCPSTADAQKFSAIVQRLQSENES